jgi:hypothetical protein
VVGNSDRKGFLWTSKSRPVPNGGLITTPRKRAAVRKRKPVHRAERHDTASHVLAASSRSDGAVCIAKQIHACCVSCGRADPPGHRPSLWLRKSRPRQGHGESAGQRRGSQYRTREHIDLRRRFFCRHNAGQRRWFDAWLWWNDTPDHGLFGRIQSLNKVFRPRQFRERLAGPFSCKAIYVNEPPDRACTFGSPDIGPSLATRAGASGLALFFATGRLGPVGILVPLLLRGDDHPELVNIVGLALGI